MKFEIQYTLVLAHVLSFFWVLLELMI